MTATQPTFNEVFDMVCMLPRQEQQELVMKVTKRELLARLEHADAGIDKGQYVEHEVAKQHFQSRMAQKSAWL